ncbi:MAG: peptidase U32 family protein [Vulcanimicrobiota bacterium]
MSESNVTEKFYIAVSISSFEMLKHLNFDLFDFIITGDPFCRSLRDNPTRDMETLDRAIRYLEKNRGKVAFSLPVAPIESEIPYIDNVLAKLEKKFKWIEVHSPAMAMMIKNKKPNFRCLFSSMANVYSNLTANLMKSYDCAGGVLPYEMELEEIDMIKNSINMPIFLTVFGQVPISFSQYCMYYPQKYKYPFICQQDCEEGTVIDYGEGLKILHKGRVIYSLQSINMFEHLEDLVKRGFRHFRIEGNIMTADVLNQVAELLHNRLKAIASGKRLQDINKVLLDLSPTGFCNGFYFGKRGIDYVNSAMQVVDNFAGLTPGQAKTVSGGKKITGLSGVKDQK